MPVPTHISKITEIPEGEPVVIYNCTFGGLSRLGKGIKLNGKLFMGLEDFDLIPWSEVSKEYRHDNHVPLRACAFMPTDLTDYQKKKLDANRQNLGK